MEKEVLNSEIESKINTLMKACFRYGKLIDKDNVAKHVIEEITDNVNKARLDLEYVTGLQEKPIENYEVDSSEPIKEY
jgi:hypothetical protein